MPIDFLWGDEDFLIEKAVTKIKNEVLQGKVNELNYRKIDSPDFSLFYETIRTNAMMFGDVIILIKCPNFFLTTKNKKELNEKQTNLLIEALKNVSEKVHIVLICPTPRGEKKKPDSRKKLYKEIQKLAKIQEFPSYKNYEEYKLIPIIKKLASEIDININDKVCSSLIKMTGPSLRDLNTQLEKLKLYAYPNTTIKEEIVQKTAAINIDVFSVLDFVLKKDYTTALNLISDIIQKEHYFLSFSLFQTMISNLVKTKIFSKTLSSFDIARKTGQSEFVVQKNIEKISKIPIDELVRLKINFTKIDYLLKTGIIKDPLTGYELAFLSCDIGEY